MKRRTIDRVLSRSGIGSRAEARRRIEEGRVRVNEEVERDPERWIDPARDHITFDGQPLGEPERIYLAFHKPAGYLTTRRDPEGRPTIFDLLGNVDRQVIAVGRLDRDTSGLLLLTNDTDLAEGITNPESHLPKTYRVKASTFLSDERLDQLRNGVMLEGKLTRPATVTRLRNPGGKTVVELTITEGRNRQVRRMLQAVGSKVTSLTRIAIGSVALGDLPTGRFRQLTVEELDALRSEAAVHPRSAPLSRGRRRRS